MTIPTNALVNVETFNKSNLAALQNLFAFIEDSNKKYKGFEKITGQLGSTVSFDLPPRMTTVNSLTISMQPAVQRKHQLTVDKSVSSSYAFDEIEYIYNARDYMEKFGKAAVSEIGTQIESNVAGNLITAPYRFYGDGVAQINSRTQLAEAVARYRNYGAPSGEIKGYLPDMAVPEIIGNGLQEFVLNRNESDALSWDLGPFARCKWRQSNLLPIHTAGSVGDGATDAIQTLTVVSTNDPTGANITQITCTCDASLSGDADAIKENDLAYFVTPLTFKYLTFVGHKDSENSVQFRITADAGASGTTVVLDITPGLSSVTGKDQNINANVVAGMTIKVMPSHRRGGIIGGNALFLGAPRMTNKTPFPSHSIVDPDSGMSLRTYYGSRYGEPFEGVVHDCVYGSTLVPEYSMALLFPL